MLLNIFIIFSTGDSLLNLFASKSQSKEHCYQELKGLIIKNYAGLKCPFIFIRLIISFGNQFLFSFEACFKLPHFWEYQLRSAEFCILRVIIINLTSFTYLYFFDYLVIELISVIESSSGQLDDLLQMLFIQKHLIYAFKCSADYFFLCCLLCSFDF